MNYILILISILILGIIFRPTYHEPRVFRNFLPHEACEHIIKQATPKLQPSVVSMEKKLDNSVRKSETAWLGSDDPVVKSIMEKCVSKTDRPIKNCETLQVLKYTPGGFYKPHQDAFADEKNMRMHTCIIALNDDYEGGETDFPNLGKKYKLNKGDMLLFDTTDDWGKITPKAVHGGSTVLTGEKWICNLWIHTYPYTRDV